MLRRLTQEIDIDAIGVRSFKLTMLRVDEGSDGAPGLETWPLARRQARRMQMSFSLPSSSIAQNESRLA